MNECNAGDLTTSQPQLFINLLFSRTPIHPCLCYTSRIGSVISGIYVHLSHSSLVCLRVCVCVREIVRVSICLHLAKEAL